MGLRDGVDATRLVTAVEEAGRPLGELLNARFPGQDEYLAQQFSLALVVDAGGAALTAESRLPERSPVWLYRQLPDEVEVPFEMPILYQDERIVVVDKPHFLATMPRGSRVVQSALVRLRRDLDCPTLAPAHRLDRLTAGVLLFTVEPAFRGAYQQLFAQRRARKEYLALAAIRPELAFPLTVSSRIEKTPGIMRAFEVPGPPNAESVVELVSTAGDVGTYRLTPRTGKTHQLRLHMSGLGLPILGDPLYPAPAAVHPASGDFTNPLQLLARVLEFDDPVDGAARRFESQRKLS